jgi:hypothetical protein
MALAIILRIVGERNGERGKGKENVRFTLIRMVPQLPTLQAKGHCGLMAMIDFVAS